MRFMRKTRREELAAGIRATVKQVIRSNKGIAMLPVPANEQAASKCESPIAEKEGRAARGRRSYIGK